MAVFLENNVETSGFIKGAKFLGQLMLCWIVRKKYVCEFIYLGCQKNGFAV
jgi:hypothetical protein